MRSRTLRGISKAASMPSSQSRVLRSISWVRLALVTSVTCARPPVRQGLGDHALRIGPDLHRVMFDPTWPGIDLLVLLLRYRHDLAGAVEHDEAARGGALVDGPDQRCGHGAGLLNWPRSRVRPA